MVIKMGTYDLIAQNFDELYHHGIKGQKWGIRRFQNPDGSLTPEGKRRYGTVENFKKEQAVKRKVQKAKWDHNSEGYKQAKKEYKRIQKSISESPTVKSLRKEDVNRGRKAALAILA